MLKRGLFLLLLWPSLALGQSLLATWSDQSGHTCVSDPATCDQEAEFILERCSGDLDACETGPFTVVGRPPQDAESWTDTNGLDSGTTYTYRIAASNSQGQSPYSNVAEATTTTPSPPDTLLTLSCERVEELEPVSPYLLMVSSSPDRSNPIPLSGETVSGVVYIFVDPETDIDQVRFFLDDPDRTSPHQTESLAPFDLAGTEGSSGPALPFDSTTITNGSHTIMVEIDAGGEINAFVVEWTFTVQN